MNKHILLFASLLSIANANIPTLAPNTADDNESYEHTHTLSNAFEKVSIDGNIQIEISRGKPELYSINNSKEAPDLLVEVKDNILFIAQKNSGNNWTRMFNWRSTDDRKNIKLKLQSPELTSIRMHSMSHASLKSPFKLENISLSGASKLTIDPNLSTNRLSIQLRGFSRFNAADISARDVEIHQSDMSTLNTAFIAANQFESTTHGQCMQHITAIESSDVSTSLSGQARTEIDRITTEKININVDGSSLYNIRQLKTQILEARMAGSSELHIRQGLAKKSLLQSHNNSNYTFGTFNPGKTFEVDTTRDA